MRMLTESDARSFASCTEDIIEVVCHGCVRANLDGAKLGFCPIQAQYSAYGEHPDIVGKKVGGRLRVKCLKMELPPRPPRPMPDDRQLNLFGVRA